METLIVIGNGIAGTTVARHVRKKSDMRIIIISAESKHFYSRTALMYIYMGHMKYEHTKPYEDWFWTKNKIELVQDYVKSINSSYKTIELETGTELNYDHLVIATGSQSNKFGWPGQELPGVQGLYSLQDLELMETNTKNINRAVIVGGGLIGIEMAEMLHSRDISVTFLIREAEYWDNILPINEAQLVGRHIIENGIDLRKSTNLKEIVTGDTGRVASIITESDERIECQFVGLTAGVHPNIDLVKNTEIKTNRGILVDEQLKTNLDSIYACGDCAEIVTGGEKRVEQLWYTGKIQAEALAQIILGKSTNYDRGIWYNSAKFFDIEYQTYGFVANQQRTGESSFYWEDDSGKRCLRIIFDQKTNAVIGMNVFGIRMRQNVWQNWIKQKRTIDDVITRLRDANFDPEFFKQFESEILDTYNQMFSKKLQLKNKNWLFKRAQGKYVESK